MAAVERARSTTSSMNQSSRDNSLAAPAQHKSNISSSATSVYSSDGHGDARSDMHSSGDGALDKKKSRGSEDASSETSSHRRRLSKLFKGRKPRRKSVQDDTSTLDFDEDVPPVPDMPTIKAPTTDDQRFQSEESLGLHKSVPSSLLTDDSDAESSPGRPGISPHHSHSGLLTLSSPLINSETLDSVAPSEATLINSTASLEDDLPTPRQAQTIDVAAVKRGTSPVNKLKEAFVPTRRSTSPKSASDTTEAARPTSSSGLGALFGGKKRDTRILDDKELQASPPQISEGKDTQSPSLFPKSGPKPIITHIPATPPNLVDAPTTLVTPPTPTDGTRPASPASASSLKNGGKHGASHSNPNVVVSPSGNMISHRRARSATNPPSKLSNSITAPLTPTIEEAKTPGGTAVPPQSPGFFSSVFSAAQNAANTLTTTITNSTTQTKNKTKAEDKKTDESGGEEVIVPENAQPTENLGTEKRRLAVETLGSGNLSLAQLGISDHSDHSPMSSTKDLPLGADEASARTEDMAAAQAVSAAYAAEPSATTNGDRPRSVTATSGLTSTSAGTISSPARQAETYDSPAPASIQRQGSIRSRISGGRRRRHRGSSATTGNTIAAAIGASTHTLAPQASLSGQRLNGTGFAVASSKRNKDFHAQFKSVPEDDYLIEDYSAALQKEILLQGRLYVSEGHLCFSSNILGWVTNLVISFDEVVSVEKKSTAVVFPNAIAIQTLHSRSVFASFLTRDSTYDLIIGIWKISHPNLKSSLNGVTLDGSGTGDKTEKAESVVSEEGSSQDSEDEVYDEDAEEEDGIGSFTEAGEGSVAGSERESIPGEARKVSSTVAQAVSGGSAKLIDTAEAVAAGAPTAQDFPGASTHAPTECGDNDQHYDKLLIDTTIPAPLGKVYSLMFGPASGAFMRKWLIEDQKSTDLQLEDDGKGLDDNHKSMTFSYTKPLGGGIGPSKTRCNITSTLEQFNLEKAVTVLCSTGTPDVPSGNVFLTKTRYCLMWGPNNSTRLLMTFTVEWSGKSWLKGPIEKGANDGQMTYATSLSAALRTAVVRNAVSKAPGKPGKGKKRSKTQITDDAISSPTPSTTTVANQPKEPSWGILDPLRSLLPGPLVSILDMLLTTQNMLFLFGALTIYAWFFRTPTSSLSPHAHLSTVQRHVAYEQIWRSEEAELWNWLEERVALDRVHGGVKAERAGEGRRGAVAQGIRERQLDEAIRTTEEKLRALKGAVGRERETGTRSPREEQT